MDRSTWQTLSTFDLIHSSHIWIQAILLGGRHSTTMQIRLVSRLWFCRKPWRLKADLRWHSVHFRKSHVRANKLDVQETDFRFTQFYRSCGNFSRCRFTQFPLSIFGIWWLTYFIPHPTSPTTPKMKESHCETKKEEDIAVGKPIAKARPRQKPTVALTSVSVLVPRKELNRHSNTTITRSQVLWSVESHDQIATTWSNSPRWIDGAVKCEGIVEEWNNKKREKFDDASQWSLHDWISILAKGGGAKKRFQYCLNPNSSSHILYLRAIQGHSGDNTVDPELQDNESVSLLFNPIKDNQRSKHEETCCVTPHQTSKPQNILKIQPSTTILSWVMLIMFRRTRSLLYFVRCFTFWGQWSRD